MDKLKIGVVSFTDPRAVKGISEIDAMNLACQRKLVKSLAASGFDVTEPLDGKLVRSRASALEAAAQLQASGADALAFGCWKWTDPMLAVDIARKLSKPVCLVGDNSPASTALGCVAAIGAALLEIAPNPSAANHYRSIGDFENVARWARGAGSLSWLSQKSILLWGGSYCLKMAHLDDDPSALKSFIIGDILVEDEYMLVSRAEKILADPAGRAEKFIAWLKKGGCKIEYDKKMITSESLKRQAALYLAARDRLAELEAEDIAGVSIKCQPALSEEWGATACLIPAFLPFGADSEGKRVAVATTCEGDIKGLITSLLLQRMADGAPAGFGDIRNIAVKGKELLVISNCGGASAHYAAISDKASNCLPRIRLRGQCQGKSGAAVGYMTPAFGKATIARLVRKQGVYSMQYALGNSVEVTEKTLKQLGWGDMWPVSLFDIDMNLERFAATVASNHFSFIPGDLTRELAFFCAEAGVEMESLNG